jgi:hypothetical protein
LVAGGPAGPADTCRVGLDGVLPEFCCQMT